MSARAARSRFEDKVVIVTGSGSGVGRAELRAFAREGARVVIAELNRRTLDEAAEEIKALGQDYTAVPTDVTVRSDVANAVQKAVEAFGRIDILVNNAGSGRPSNSPGLSRVAEEVTDEDLDHVMDLNLKGTLYFCQAVIPHMKRQKSGAIVNTASVIARALAYPAGVSRTSVCHAAAKGAVVGLTKKLAFELGPTGIRVNCVAPGYVASSDEMRQLFVGGKSEAELDQWYRTIALRRLGTAEDIAAAVAFLASEEAAYVTGVILDVNGGMYSA